MPIREPCSYCEMTGSHHPGCPRTRQHAQNGPVDMPTATAKESTEDVEFVDYFSEALNHMPGVVDATRARDAVKARRDAARSLLLRDAGAVRRDLLAAVVAAANDGKPFPSDLGRQAAEAGHASAHAQAELEILATALDHFDAQLNGLHRQHASRGLEHLATYLPGLLRRARVLDTELGQVHTAEQAVNATPAHVAAWQELGRLAEAYTSLRRAQRSLTLYGLHGTHVGTDHGHGLDLLRQAGEMADLFEVWPRWDEENDRFWPAQPTPWPADSDPVAQRYTRDYVRWAGTTTAHLWIPTIPELEAATERFARLTQVREAYSAAKRGATDDRRWSIPDGKTIAEMVTAYTEKEGLTHDR
jgi:hypothetical protein